FADTELRHREIKLSQFPNSPFPSITLYPVQKSPVQFRTALFGVAPNIKAHGLPDDHVAPLQSLFLY
uniref:Uncharacterized protein n=2 Tax=Gopherus TaxID=38771 RepID=A0A8C4YP37_9SAUR